MLTPNVKGQRREPAAGDVEFVSKRIGWLRFAGPSGSQFNTMFMELHFGQGVFSRPQQGREDDDKPEASGADDGGPGAGCHAER